MSAAIGHENHHELSILLTVSFILLPYRTAQHISGAETGIIIGTSIPDYRRLDLIKPSAYKRTYRNKSIGSIIALFLS